jgi:hypothetical protein
LLRPKPITCGILQEYEFDYCCSFTCFQDSQRVDPIKGGHQAAPAVHLPYGPNQVIADSAGSVFTLQLMEVDQAKTIKSKPPVASETEIHCRKLAVFPQIHFLKPLGNIHQSVSYIIYIYIYISPYVYHYPSVSDSFYSQVSPFLLSIAPPSVAIFGAPAAETDEPSPKSPWTTSRPRRRRPSTRAVRKVPVPEQQWHHLAMGEP